MDEMQGMEETKSARNEMSSELGSGLPNPIIKGLRLVGKIRDETSLKWFFFLLLKRG